jgi:two-component system chemotaxis sensor kinase CheA
MTNDAYSRDPMLEMFLFETTQLIEQLEELLLEIEKSGQLSSTAVHEIFRIMHTIKGSAAMMDFHELSRLSHALEDLFDQIRTHHEWPVNCVRLTDQVLLAIDFVKAEIGQIEAGQDSTGQADALIAGIRAFQADFCSQAAQSADSGLIGYAAHLFFEEGCQMENMRAFTVVHSLAPFAVDLAYFPADIADNESSAEVIRENGFQIYLTSLADPQHVQDCFEQGLFIDRLKFSVVDQFPAGIFGESAEADPGTTWAELTAAQPGDPSLPLDSADPVSRGGAAKQQSLISVNIAKLDQLMDLVGELVISEAMVTKNPDLEGLQLHQFQKASRQLHKLTNELQDIVMSIRMVPVAATFHKMQRIVRDMTRKLGKDVALHLSGEETEVDKRIIDSLADPLMHLIRNALDHGLESPAERQATGKPAQGQLHLAARSVGGDIWITIRDDGRGLDKSRILDKARQQNLLTKPETDYSEKEIFSFILLPGFSTRDAVSEFSGRGVGMDVVRENIGKLGGLISLDSVAGQGTTVSIRIPLTLAIINGMQIAVGQSSYIIPITAIRESFRLRDQQAIVDTEGREMLMIRGQCCNVLRLHRHYEVETRIDQLDQGILVIVEDEDRPFCLFADRLVGEQQVVVKPLPTYLQKTAGLAGCTILGDGSISLILDVGGLAAS